MIKIILVLVLSFSSGEVAIDKLIFDEAQDCLETEAHLIAQFQKTKEIENYFTICLAPTKREKS
jgi:hypothetical protein